MCIMDQHSDYNEGLPCLIEMKRQQVDATAEGSAQEASSASAAVEAVRENIPSPRKEEGGDPNYFPAKLHRMLTDIDNDFPHFKELISWQPHGRCFMIRDEARFTDEVMPRWFRHLKFNSFRRQLHLFGFRKVIRQGPDKGAYYYDTFTRGVPELAAQMKPTKGKGKRGRKPKSEETCPDFYEGAFSTQRMPGSLRATNQAIPQLASQDGRLQAGRTIFDQRIQMMPARVQESKLSDDGGDFVPRTDLLGLQLSAFGQEQQARFPTVPDQASAPATNYAGDRFLSSSSTIAPYLENLQTDVLEPLSLDTANHVRVVNSASFPVLRGSQPAQDIHSAHHQGPQRIGQQHQGHIESALLVQQRKIRELEQQLQQNQLWMQQQQQQQQLQQQQFNPNQAPTRPNFHRQDSLVSYESLDYPAAYQEQLQGGQFLPLLQGSSAFDQSTFSMQQIFAQQQRGLQVPDLRPLAIPTAPALYENQSGQPAESESAPAPMDGQEGDAFGWNPSF